MLDVLFPIILGPVVSMWVYKYTDWFRSIEDTSKKYSDKLFELIVKSKDKSKTDSGYKEIVELLYKIFENFNNSYDNYLHLRERFKHNEKGKQVEKDWRDYLRETKIVLNKESLWPATL